MGMPACFSFPFVSSSREVSEVGAPSWAWHGKKGGHSRGSRVVPVTGFFLLLTVACPPPIPPRLCLLQLVSESCPRLTFLKLSDCHGVTSDTLVMLARACPQLHSLDIQHSMVSPVSPGAPKKPKPR